METKVCTKCGIEKELNNVHFYNRKASKDGYSYGCIPCNKYYSKEYRKTEKYKERTRLYTTNNKEKLKEYDKAYRDANKEKKRASMKIYCKENKEKIKKAWGNYINKNRDYRIEYNANYQKKKIKEDKCYAARTRISHLLNSYIKRTSKKDARKNNITLNVVGLEQKDLMKHLIKTFESNYKVKWKDEYMDIMHVDHIIPISSVTNEESVYQLFYYTNLQFLYAGDNLSKGSKMKWKLDLKKTGFFDKLKSRR